ncbi:MAG: DUF302 domain-containing protein [Gammaproteobacteria bacterium]|nr:DUF302 domain-containing protein [Gammaproteobacteria bacterium]
MKATSFSTGTRALLLAFSLFMLAPVQAANRSPLPGTITVHSRYGFRTLVQRLTQSITANHMVLVARASASRGAAARGIRIPGNEVLMVFRNDYAVRMLAASIPAGIEAPLRLYVTEEPDGTASVTYRRPSAVFAPYGSPKLDAMAAELDPIFAKIVSDAVGR